MTDQHPSTPLSELAEKWYQEAPDDDEMGLAQHIATQAARWGADQELEACCEWLNKSPVLTEPHLRAARRPKPPSLKEQALALLKDYEASDDPCDSWDFSTVRRALEQLND